MVKMETIKNLDEVTDESLELHQVKTPIELLCLRSAFSITKFNHYSKGSRNE